MQRPGLETRLGSMSEPVRLFKCKETGFTVRPYPTALTGLYTCSWSLTSVRASSYIVFCYCCHALLLSPILASYYFLLTI